MKMKGNPVWSERATDQVITSRWQREHCIASKQAILMHQMLTWKNHGSTLPVSILTSTSRLKRTHSHFSESSDDKRNTMIQRRSLQFSLIAKCWHHEPSAIVSLKSQDDSFYYSSQWGYVPNLTEQTYSGIPSHHSYHYQPHHHRYHFLSVF